MEIRNLKQEDIKKVMSLENMVFPKNIAEKEEVILDRIITFNRGCFGIFEKEKLIGYCSSEVWEDYKEAKRNIKASLNHKEKGKILYITALAISPEYQKRGFGKKLIKKLIKTANNFKLFSLYLRISEPLAKKAKGFYEKNGFEPVRYISKRNDNHYLMELKINKI